MSNAADFIGDYNKERWEELAQAGVPYSRPFLDLTPEKARAYIDHHSKLGDVTGKHVICVAGGGGQQGPCFKILGAERVVIFDISETQLERERQAQKHYYYEYELEQGDMRDLSRFEDHSFDIVYHAHSLNFVPDPERVFQEEARIIKSGGLFYTSYHNPMIHGMEEADWNGEGYVMRMPFEDGAQVVYDDPCWDVRDSDGIERKIVGPHEFRHSIGRITSSLADNGFRLLGVWEEEIPEANPDAEPGTWAHYCAYAPPWIEIWAVKG